MRVLIAKLGISALFVGLVTGCSVFDPDLGVRVENNTEKQTVDPYAGFDEGVATLDGAKAEKLLHEYRTEKPAASSESLLQDVVSE